VYLYTSKKPLLGQQKTTNLNLINKGNKFAIFDGVVGSQFYGYMGPWVHGSMGWVWVLELLEQLEMIGASRAPLGKKRCPRGTPKTHKKKKVPKRHTKESHDPEKNKIRQGAGTILELFELFWLMCEYECEL